MAGRVRWLLERMVARRVGAAGAGVSDAELLGRYTRDRDEAAFELLVWRHGGMVFGVCRRTLGDEQLAEDAFQAVFLVLARKAGNVRGSNLAGWLFQVARRVSARAVARRPRVAPLVELPAPLQADRTERDELAELLDAEIARLPERLRRAVVLCYLGGRSTEEAARELGCPRGTVLSRLATARQRLAARLTRRGVTLPATLTAPGLVLTNRVVSSAVELARPFRAGSLVAGSAASLAEGVIQTMARTTLATAFGSTLVAAALVTGVGWVAAQPEPRGETTTGAAPLAPPAAPKAEPPAPNVPPPDQRKEADEKIRQLEKLKASLQQEIELQEKAIAAAERNNGAAAGTLVPLQKRWTEADALYVQASRERDKLDAEAKVLKRLLNAKKPAVEPDPAVIEQTVARETQHEKASVDRLRADYNRELQKSPAGAETPSSKELKTRLERAETELKEGEKRAWDHAVELHRTNANATLRERLAKVTTDAEIQTEVRERLKEERDALQKVIANAAAAAVNVEEMRKAVTPQREALDAVQRQVIRLRLQNGGFERPPADATDAKLDLLLREIAELRKEVRELKNQK